MTNQENKSVAIEVSKVKKMYRLGQIGGGTLQADLQSWWARIRGKEDPNTLIGDNQRSNGETFMALNGVDLTIFHGEAVGIVGSNGAGKSTLLKLLSKVTAPTEGVIDIYGRVSSMLEVGTGFNGELTGRENVYMNGSILGMTREEIDKKMEDIIDFSEVREFIDTPVKRYSSGMFVKLAFSVAAHLDSEIMIMDEVLAVGDINFQQKCLKKMRNIACEDGRTVLYVSHNMSTIKSLCTRCIVMDKGKIIYNGDVDTAIQIYSSNHAVEKKIEYDVSQVMRGNDLAHGYSLSFIRCNKSTINMGETLSFQLEMIANCEINHALIRFIVFNQIGAPVGMAYSDFFSLFIGVNHIDCILNTSSLVPGAYITDIVLCEYVNDMQIRHDGVDHVFSFDIVSDKHLYNVKWNSQSWGHIVLPSIKIINNGD